MTPSEQTTIDQEAIAANEAFFNKETTRRYVEVSPHVKYPSLRNLYSQLVADILIQARKYSAVPTVLDLGAGEGSATLPFLEMGARVVAVDVSESQLAELRRKCDAYKDRLEVRLGDLQSALATGERYDVMVMSSCLHHIPDYLAVIDAGVNVLSKTGQFFSFQDPVRYDTMSTISRWLNKTMYLSWRVFQGDFFGGVSRRLRRARGIYLEDCPADNTEYHVVRGGVDQDKIVQLLFSKGFDCRVVRYFSTQGSFFQPLGSALGIQNTFAVIAKRQA
jgi:2-polyprenyl-3-methyl-5-hydroxy-6-metoxy-1,4-benzoquinol methylase